MEARSGMLGAITALAALITAGTSLYVAVREPATSVSVLQGPTIAQPARAWADEESDWARHDARRDDDPDVRPAALRYDRFDDDPDHGFDEDFDECTCDPAPLVDFRRMTGPPADFRAMIDRYDRFARDLIESIGR